jgi:hypothetical protein
VNNRIIIESQIGKDLQNDFKICRSKLHLKNIYSIKADTNYDNLPMLRYLKVWDISIEVLEKSTKAFEKTLKTLIR